MLSWSGTAASLTNRDCRPALRSRRPQFRRISFFFQPSRENRLIVVLKLRYLALNCKALKGHSTRITVVKAFFFSFYSRRLLPLSCFVNILKVSVLIKCFQIRVDVNETIPFVISVTYGYSEGTRAPRELLRSARFFWLLVFYKVPLSDFSAFNRVSNFIFDNIMLSHQVNYDFNLIESSAMSIPDFTFKLLPHCYSTFGDLWKLENSKVYKVFFIASANFVV